MEISVAEQMQMFLFSILFGLFLGALFDAFRILRLALPSGKAAVFLEDSIFLILAAILTFLFIYKTNFGDIRFYLLLGTILGALLYYFTIGILVMKSARAVIKFVKKFILAVLKVILKPLRKIYWFFSPFFKKITQNLKIFKKNFTKLFLFKLKQYKIYTSNFLTKNNANKRTKIGDEKIGKEEKSKSFVKNKRVRRGYRFGHNPAIGVSGYKRKEK